MNLLGSTRRDANVHNSIPVQLKILIDRVTNLNCFEFVVDKNLLIYEGFKVLLWFWPQPKMFPAWLAAKKRFKGKKSICLYFNKILFFIISGTKQHLGPVQLGTGNDQGGGGKANNNQRIKECAWRSKSVIFIELKNECALGVRST